MKISKNNIMVRMCEEWDNDVPENLCPFVRKVGLLCVAGLLLGAILGLLLFTLFYNVFVLGYYFTTGLYGGGDNYQYSMLIFLIVITIVGVGNGAWWCLCKLFSQAKKATPETLGVPSIIREYYKAKHDKFCPKIDIVEEK